MKNKKYEFIVAYCARFCKVEGKEDARFYANRSDSMAGQYEYILRCSNKSWGDIVLYNNQFWCAVMASNAREALDVLFEKQEKRD